MKRNFRNQNFMLSLPVITAVWFLSALFLPFVVCLAQESAEEVPDPVALALAATERYEQINDYSVIFFKQELIDGKLLPLETTLVKFRKPFDFYMKWIEKPYKNREMLYKRGANNDKLLAHEGGLLGLVTVSLDPRGSMALKGNHHPVCDAGLGSTIHLITRGLKLGLERKEVTVTYHGREKLGDRPVKVLEGIFPEKCVGRNHTVKAGEDLWSIAQQYDQDMYVILANNDGISDPYDIEEGQTILVPYYYCRKIMVYLDEELGVPIKLLIYDWKNNLYEMYQYKNLKINVGLTDMDFDPDNREYNF